MKISTYINQAYPFYYEDLRKVSVLLFCVAVASGVFSFLFEPFVVNEAEHKIDSLWILVLHSAVPIPIALVYFFFLKRGIRNVEEWTLAKEFLHLGIIFLLIGFADFLLRDFIYTNPDNWSLRYLWEEVRNTFLVGSLLLLIILPLNLERLLQKYNNSLKAMPSQPLIEQKNSVIQVRTPIAAEQFELDTKTFLFAKVESNYLEIFYSESEGFDKYLKRMTLKEFYDQLSPFPFIFQVHRSYLVNLQAIKSISGNAQGYTLRLQDYVQRTIPVSRSKIQEFSRLYTDCVKQ